MGLFSKLQAGLKKARANGAPAGEGLRASGLFDADWYRATYPEALRDGRDPIEEYLSVGAAEGRNPNPFFNTAWYLNRYPDVREAGVNPLVHYIEAGAAEGRDPGPGFETAFYLADNPAVAASGMNPLLHYLRHGRAEGRPARQIKRDPIEQYEAVLATRRGLAGAARLDHVHFPLHPRTQDRDAEGRPWPPLALARRIGAPTLDEFDFVGRETKRTILRCLPKDFDFAGARVLDFGCGVGRVLRHFSEEAEQAEIWGCDIDGPSIRWSVGNLSPPFRLFQLSEIPTVPLESNSYDLIYAISVFAHIHADWHHWMAEMRRILKPGGCFFVTFMAQTPFEEMLGRSFSDLGPDFGKFVKNPFADWNDGGPMAFHNPEWIKAYWGNLFDIEFLALDGLLEYQSICFMRKPRVGAPIRTDAPVLRYSTTQGFNPDAVGRIYESHDRARPFLESYGVEAKNSAEIGGWIAFRGDKPAALEVRVDDTPVDVEFEFHPGTPYRDWADSVQTAYRASFDVSGMKPGEHRMEVAITGQGGKSHAMTIPLVVLP